MYFLDSEQRAHLETKSLSFRVFLKIVVFKPIINSLWDTYIPVINITLLQSTSILIVLIFFFGIFKKSNLKISLYIRIIFALFTFLYIYNVSLVVLNNFELDRLKMLVKICVYPLSFYYFKNNINSVQDFNLILNAFIKSIIPAIIVGIYDGIINPGDQIMETRGVIRIDSSFGDIANIGLHINMIFIIMYYNFMNERKNYSTSIINIFIPFFIFLTYNVFSN